MFGGHSAGVDDEISEKVCPATSEEGPSMSRMVIEESGRGACTVLIHGIPSSPRYFDPLARELTKTRRVLVPHLPGVGLSAQLSGAYPFSAIADLLVRELLDRGVTRFSVGGFSSGAYRALELALDTRVEVTGVALLGAIAGLDESGRSAFGQFAALAQTDTDLMPLFLSRTIPPEHAARYPHHAAEVRSWLETTPRSVLVAELTSFAAAPDLGPRLGEIDSPLYLRVGEADVATPPALSTAIHDASRRARLDIVPRCGHCLLLEDRDATVHAMASALGDPA